MSNRHDLPCWCGKGQSCVSLYNKPEPHLHCFKCGEQNWDEEEVELFRMDSGNLVRLEKKPSAPTPLFPQRGVITNLDDRSIDKDVAEKYGVETLFNGDNKRIGRAYPAYDDTDSFVGQKLKALDKRQRWIGSTTNLKMFGQRLFPAGGKYLTITEGEEDCLAVYQMMKRDRPQFEHAVISLNNGAGSAVKECQKQWEYINSFENIILCFDGDEPGRKAAQEVSKLFHHKPKTVSFGEARQIEKEDGTKVWENKDANDYLRNNRGKDFLQMWWNSERLAPKGVLPFKGLWDSMTKENDDLICAYPFAGLDKLLHGQRRGHFVVWKAAPKIGKTQLMREIAYKIRKDSEANVGLIFLEDTKKSIGLGMCALHLNRPIQFPDVPYTMEELKAAHDFLSEDERIVIFDPEDERSAENIINKIIYFVKAHNCQVIILDHISMLAYAAEDDNERKFLDKLSADLKALTTQLDICLHAIVHVNDDGKTRGSRAPVLLCNALIDLQRDKLNPDPFIANTIDVIVTENRLTGESGLACKLFFDRETGRLKEVDHELAMNVDGRSVQFDT